MAVPRKLELPYNSTFHLWVYNQKNVKSQRDTCTPMSTAGLLTAVSKQVKCPLTDECINKLGYTHKMEHYLSLKERKF